MCPPLPLLISPPLAPPAPAPHDSPLHGHQSHPGPAVIRDSHHLCHLSEMLQGLGR